MRATGGRPIINAINDISETNILILLLLFGVALTAFIFYFIVLPRYARREADLAKQLKAKGAELAVERGIREQIGIEHQATKVDLHHTQLRLKEQKKELETLNTKLTEM